MGSALSVLRTKVYNALSISGSDVRLPNATVNNHINDAVDEVASWVAWPELVVNANVSLTAGDSEETLAVTFQTIYTVSVTFNGVTDYLEGISYAEYLEKSYGGAADQRARPTFYAISGDEVYFSPTPDQAYTAVIRGLQFPTSMTADANLCSLGTYLDRVIVKLACVSCCETLSDVERVGLYERAIARMRTDLMNQAQRQSASSRPRIREDWAP